MSKIVTGLVGCGMIATVTSLVMMMRAKLMGDAARLVGWSRGRVLAQFATVSLMTLPFGVLPLMQSDHILWRRQ